MICPNLKDKVVKQKFDELIDALGEPLAYLTYHRNKGNFLELNPDGSESTSFKELLDAVDGDRKKALQLRSKYFTSENTSESIINKVNYNYKELPQVQSKQARNNAKIDILWSVLTNSDTFEKIFKPGGFPTLQSLAKRVLELEGRADEMLDPLLPNTQAELYRRNMTGKALIGIFANHNANHAVLQYTDIELASPIFFDGVSKTSLHDIKNSNGEFISRNVAEFLAAVVDNAKEPLSAFININTYTADVAALLTRLGFPLETVVGFLSQPILKEFTNLYFNNGANKQAESFAISQLQTRKVDKIELNTKDLFNALNKSNTTINIEESKIKIDYSNYTNFSGGAAGGDTYWKNIGKEFGVGKQIDYRPEDLQKLNKNQLEETEKAYQKAVKDLGRSPLDKNSFAGGLVRRDYLQAKAADAIYAIGEIINPGVKDKKGYLNKTNKQVVSGGTGYAVQMAINLQKPVYVFDQIKDYWFKWDYNSNNFVQVVTPTLSKKFAGIGTREINDKGIQAIRDVYNNSKETSLQKLNKQDYQLAVLQQFIDIKEQATALADLVRAMRADTKGAGPTLSENEKLINLKDKVLSDTRLVGQADVFYGNIVGPLVDGRWGDLKLQAKIFENLDKYFPKGSRITYYDRYEKLINEGIIEDYLGTHFFIGFADVEYHGRTGEALPVTDILTINGKDIQDIIMEDHPYRMITEFQNSGIEKPTEVLSEYFPWMHLAFKEIKTIIQDNLKGKDLTVQQIEKINYELLGFAASGFEFFNGKDREDILFNLPKQLKEFKENNKEFVDENPFLKKLLYRTADEIKTTDRQKKKGKVYIDRIEFKNTGSLTDAEKVEVQNAWKDLFVKNKDLANKLVKYTFYTSGFQLTPQSFGHLVPVQFYSTLKDSNGDSFNNYLDIIIDESKESERVYKNSGFIDQFYRNNWDDTSFVPPVDITPSSRNISSDIVFIGDMPVAFEVDSNDKNTRQDFVLEKDKYGATFIPYIKYNYKGTVYLFKASPTQNPWISQYDVIEKLGIPNYMMEYSRTAPVLESVVADNILPDEIKGVEVSSDIPKAVDTVSITEEELEERIKLCNPK